MIGLWGWNAKEFVDLFNPPHSGSYRGLTYLFKDHYIVNA